MALLACPKNRPIEVPALFAPLAVDLLADEVVRATLVHGPGEPGGDVERSGAGSAGADASSRSAGTRRSDVGTGTSGLPVGHGAGTGACAAFAMPDVEGADG